MPIVSVIFGALLIAVGIWGRFGGDLGLWQPLGFAAPERLSGTALIPAYVGSALFLLGLLALKPAWLKHAMHAAAAIGLLGFLAASGRLIHAFISTGTPHGVGGASVTLMTLLCAAFVALCVNSFVQTRRRRRKLNGAASGIA